MIDKKYWLAFHLVQHIGSVRLHDLYTYFGSLEIAWFAEDSALRHAGLGEQALAALHKARSKLDLDAELEKIERHGAHLVTLDDTNYPDNLRGIADAPPLLYVKGNLLAMDTRSLAIVGTRKATRYGTDAAQRMARWIAAQGVTIISGLAQGIDAAAHQGALEADYGRTIAVLGCGIDTIYPREHTELAQAIMQNGAIISEFPIGMPPTGTNFPRRNRIISGMALGVLVAEAPDNSGAIITAEAALEQGREVFAIPANIFNPMGTGSNRLIQEGAKLVMKAQDILNELSISYSERAVRQQAQRIVPENPTEAHILSFLETEPIHINELVRLTGLAIAELSATLAILELKGLAQSPTAMQYCRVN